MTDLIVLAAGQGKRMGGNLPKGLVQVKGRPMVSYVLDAIKQAGLQTPVVVVGHGADMVREALGSEYRYAEQTERLGTGHAVKTGLSAVKDDATAVMVMYCDQPLISAATIKAINDRHIAEQPTITMATVQVGDFNEWRDTFTGFGRIIRDANGNIIRSVEKKDATPEELAITEVNPCYFCFDKNWLAEALNKISNENAQKEYYLTDLIALAISENKKISHVSIPVHEALGANTPEQLAILEGFVK